MQYVVNVMNTTNHYNIQSLLKAIERPKGVGLLTVCNHVSVLDTASIVPSIIPFSSILWVLELGCSGNHVQHFS